MGGRLEGGLMEEDEGRRFAIDSDEVSLRITGTWRRQSDQRGVDGRSYKREGN